MTFRSRVVFQFIAIVSGAVVAGATVPQQEVCWQPRTPLHLHCVPPPGHTCVWNVASGTEFMMDDILAHRVTGVEAANGGGACDVIVGDVMADQWSSVNCSAVSGNNTVLLSAYSINVIMPPELSETTDTKTIDSNVTDATFDGSSVLVSTAHATSVACHAPQANVAITWMLASSNITQHADIHHKGNATWSVLLREFTAAHHGAKLRCCRSGCRKRFCVAAKVRTMHKAQGFYSEYPKGHGVTVRFRADPAPTALTWGLAPSCEDPPTPLDPSTDSNVTTTLLNHTDGWFSANLVVSPANSSLGEEKLLLTVTHSEGNSTHCTTYYKTGLGSGAIVGISVAVVTTVVLLSLALFIYCRSKADNYQA